MPSQLRESFSKFADRLSPWAPAILGGLWLSGFHVANVAQAVVAVLAARYFFGGRKAETRSESPKHASFYLLFVAIFVVFSFLHPIGETLLGRQSIDFAIFTQVIDSIAHRGAPVSSLIGVSWQNFLAHHFTPILYLPGLLAMTGIPAYICGSLLHALAVAGGALSFYLSAKKLGLTRTEAAAYVFLLFVTPTFRQALFFGIHDEIFALPFLGFAFYAWICERPMRMLLCLVGASTCKESMFIVVGAFATMTLFEEALKGRYRRTQIVVSSLGLFYGFCGTVGYFFLQPFLLAKEFDHADKLASLDELFSLSTMTEKLWFLTLLLLPLIGFSLLKVRRFHLFLPALPLLAIIFVSRFEEMWKPMNYYGVIPTFLLFMAMLHQRTLSLKTWPLAVALCFCWNGKKPAKTLVQTLSSPWVSSRDLDFIPSDSTVIVSSNAALALQRIQLPIRDWQAQHHNIRNFDYIVHLEGEKLDIGETLLQLSKPCQRSGPWVIRCPKSP